MEKELNIFYKLLGDRIALYDIQTNKKHRVKSLKDIAAALRNEADKIDDNIKKGRI